MKRRILHQTHIGEQFKGLRTHALCGGKSALFECCWLGEDNQVCRKKVEININKVRSGKITSCGCNTRSQKLYYFVEDTKEASIDDLAYKLPWANVPDFSCH